MGLFDNASMPKGIQMMLANLLKEAAPQLAETVDGFAAIMREFALRLERIEANQQIIMEKIGAKSGSDTGPGNPRISDLNGKSPSGIGSETGD